MSNIEENKKFRCVPILYILDFFQAFQKGKY